MIKTLLSFYLLFICTVLYSQVHTSSVQFRENLANNNAGYLGIIDGITISSIVQNRNRANGLNSSYKSFQLDLPVRFYSMGIGISASQQTVESNQLSLFKLGYSYKIHAFKGILNFGAFAGVSQYRLDFSKQTVRSSTDPTLVNNRTQIAPTLSAGIFYKQKRVSAGLSSNNLLKNNFDFGLEESKARTSRMVLFYISSRHQITSKLIFKPAIQVETELSSPPSFTTSGQMEIDNKFWVNLGFRLNSEGFISSGIDLTKIISGFSQPIKIGLAYSVPFINEFRRRNATELFISYNYSRRPNPDKIRNQKRIVSPIIFY